MKKKISIIIPVYNTQDFLRKCIESILQQTIRDIEVILVDDGSTDNSPAICDEYAKKDSRIRVIHKKNGGLSDARNAGIEVAEGQYLGFVDSDDYVHPMMYETLLGFAEQEGAGIVQSEFYYFDDGSEPDTQKIETAGFECLSVTSSEVFQNFYTNNYVLHSTVCNKLYARDIFEEIRFPFGQYYEDSTILLPTVERAMIITVIPHRLYYYRQRTGSIMHSNYSKRWFQGTNNNNEIYLHFFRNHGLHEQADYALNDYCSRFCKDKLAVSILFPELKKDFKEIERRFRKELINVVRSSKMCKVKKVMILCLFVSPGISYKICQKLFPECLHEFMKRKVGI